MNKFLGYANVNLHTEANTNLYTHSYFNKRENNMEKYNNSLEITK